MKKFIYQAASIGFMSLAFVQLTVAQPAVPPGPPVPKAETVEKRDQTEIVIRQKGDKDTKLTVEIKNGDYFINGKPIEKFDDQNIIIEKREIDENENIVVVPEMAYSPSPFREQAWENAARGLSDEDMQRKAWDMQRKAWEKMEKNGDMQRKIQKSIQIRMNGAFLGVSSHKAEKGGATVLEVTKGSPAEKAGIRKGDIITKVNDSKIDSPESLFETIHNFKPGEKVKILLTRNGKEQAVVATLDKAEYAPKEFNYNYNFKMPPMSDMDNMMPDINNLNMGPWGHQQPKLGIKAQDAEDGKGVNILEVEDSSAAAKAGLKKGDIILQFDGTEVNSTYELVDQLQEARQKSTIKVKILRSGAIQEIEIKIPRKLKTAEL